MGWTNILHPTHAQKARVNGPPDLDLHALHRRNRIHHRGQVEFAGDQDGVLRGAAGADVRGEDDGFALLRGERERAGRPRNGSDARRP